ncbi:MULTISPECIES: TonB-dependent receptor [Chitinophagaceae]
MRIKLTALVLVLCMMHVFARTGAQTITIKANKVSLGTVLKTIKKQTGFDYFYNSRIEGQDYKVSLDVNGMQLKDALDLCFRQLPLSYKLYDKTIIVTPKETVWDNHPEKLLLQSEAPQNIVSGSVTDSTGKPLAGVAILKKGTTKGAQTDDAGNYTIEANSGDILVFSYIGYQTREIEVGNNKQINVTLHVQAAKLDDFVVVGYGTQKKKDLTGAISIVSSDALEERPNVQFGDALEGKAAGVQVLKSSGAPQAGFNIRIRGTSSITSGSDPLYIVDGVPTESISEINPADIASFSILKDASSAAIYGASGANGVVLITTKRGRSGKTVVSLDSYTGFSTVRKRIPTLNATQYADLISDMGETIDISAYNANTNWQDLMFRHGLSQNANISVRGGNEKTTFYMSGGIVKQNGILVTNTMNRANFKLNLDHNISKVFKVGTSLSYNRWYDVDVSEGYTNSAVMNTLLGAPVIGVYNDTKTQFTVDPFYQDLDNPMGLILGNNHNYVNNRFMGNMYIEAKITKDLRARSMFGYEYFHNQANSFVNPYLTTEGRSKNGIAAVSTTTNAYWISENTLTYDKHVSKHNFNVMAGFIASNTKTDASSIATHNFANGNIVTVNGGSIIDAATATTAKLSTVSFMGRLTYNYNEKYYASANIRRDASTVFGSDNMWGWFPAFSAAWRLSNEDFFKDVTFINDLKIRAGWGKVGNSQIPPYSYLGQILPTSNYVIGDLVVPGYTPSTLPNEKLHWESTNQTDIGLDLTVLDNRLTFTADYYDKKTVGLLLNIPVAASSGYTSALKNIGSLRNRGFEFSFNSKNIDNANFKWSSDFNISFNRNKVLNVDQGTINDGEIESRGNSVLIRAGLPLGSFYGYVSKGVNPQTGNIDYEMADSTIGLQTSDMKVIGNPNPNYTFGFTNTFQYKNWDLTVFLQGVQGNKVLNATRIYSEGMWELRNQTTAVLNRWRKPGDITNVPRPDYNNDDEPFGNYNSQVSSRFIEDGSYIRLKSINLGYRFQPKKVSFWTSAKVYFTAENLITWTKYSGYDPEVNAFGNSNTVQGVDFGSYPQTRNYIVGINVTF